MGVEHLVRHAVAVGESAMALASSIADQLAGPDLRIAFVFVDWQLDAPELARALHLRLAPARIVGGTTLAVIGPDRSAGHAVVALGLYGDRVRVGVGVARELSRSALVHSRQAMIEATRELGTTTEALTPHQHVGITMVDGESGQEETFCIGSAAAAPQIRVVGGCAASDITTARRPYVFVDGAAIQDAGFVAVLESELPFIALRSSHLGPTDVRVVVTAATGRMIHELDGKPAVVRMREIAIQLGDPLELEPESYSLARFIDGIPYVRSMIAFIGEQVQLASGVEPGHILRVMRPGDLIGTTRRDLAAAATQVGGTIAALLTFSCIGRHREAHARGLGDELDLAYAEYGAIGIQSYGEQSGMLLVNHTLTGLVIGAGA